MESDSKIFSILRDLGMEKGPIEGRVIDELQFLNAVIMSNGESTIKSNTAIPNIRHSKKFGSYNSFLSIPDDL